MLAHTSCSTSSILDFQRLALRATRFGGNSSLEAKKLARAERSVPYAQFVFTGSSKFSVKVWHFTREWSIQGSRQKTSKRELFKGVWMAAYSVSSLVTGRRNGTSAQERGAIWHFCVTSHNTSKSHTVCYRGALFSNFPYVHATGRGGGKEEEKN